MDKTVNLNGVIQKFKEDGSHPTSWYLGANKEDFKKVAKELVEDFKRTGADLEWWLGKSSMMGMGIVNLGPYPPKGSATIEYTVRELGFDYKIVMKNVNEKLRENLDIITDELGIDRELLRTMAKKFETGELSAQVKDIPEEIKGKVFQTALKGIIELKKLDPQNKTLWVAKTLKEHGHDEVTIKKWFYCDVLFGRMLKAGSAWIYRRLFGGR